MIGCLRTRVRKQQIIAHFFKFENELKLYNLEAWVQSQIQKRRNDWLLPEAANQFALFWVSFGCSVQIIERERESISFVQANSANNSLIAKVHVY